MDDDDEVVGGRGRVDEEGERVDTDTLRNQSDGEENIKMAEDEKEGELHQKHQIRLARKRNKVMTCKFE